MFIFLSKLLLVFLNPANWIIALIIIRYFVIRKAYKKRLLVSALVVFLIFSNKYIYYTVVNAWQPKPISLKGQQFEAGILLGGLSMFDKDGTGFFGDASDRFIEASILYKQGIIRKIIVSGGRITKDVPEEAPFLQEQLIKNGIEKQVIIVENQSKNTYENGKLTKKIVDSLGLNNNRLVLITSAFHVRRATRVFEKAGISVVPYPCDYKIINSKLRFTDYYWPNAEVLSSWQTILKEWVGIIVYELTGKA